jgi:hypothetical protein
MPPEVAARTVRVVRCLSVRTRSSAAVGTTHSNTKPLLADTRLGRNNDSSHCVEGGASGGCM